MNNKRREKLQKAFSLLESAESIIETALDEESDCLNNMPENLENSERYEKMENAVDNLEDALESISTIKNLIEEASE